MIGDTLVPVGGLVTANAAAAAHHHRSAGSHLGAIQSHRVAVSVVQEESARCCNLALTLILADNSEFPQKGRIENTLNQVDPKTGTLELQASFPNPQHTLLPGQFGKVRVETELRRNVILVPQRAIQQLQSQQTVYTVGPGI